MFTTLCPIMLIVVQFAFTISGTKMYYECGFLNGSSFNFNGIWRAMLVNWPGQFTNIAAGSSQARFNDRLGHSV